MHDRDKLAKLFDAALQQVDVNDLTPAGAHPRQAASQVPHAWSQDPRPAQPQMSPEQQEYARQIAWQQHLAEQQRLAEERQRQEMLRQAYEHQQAIARQQAWEQQQALARQQEWENHQALLRRQEWERQQAFARQQEAAPAQPQSFQPPQSQAFQQPSFQPTQPQAFQRAQDHGFGGYVHAVPDEGDLVSASPSAGPHPSFGEEPVPQSAPAAAPEVTGFVFRRADEDGMSDSEEFNAIMEAKMAKTRRKRGRGFIFTLILFGVPAIGGPAWFVSDPNRVNALRQTISDIRTAGDLKAIIASYQKSLDKLAVRGDQLNEATSMLGVDPATETGSGDDHFHNEMNAFSGNEDGPTVLERNKALQEKFAKVKENGSLMGAAKKEPEEGK